MTPCNTSALIHLYHTLILVAEFGTIGQGVSTKQYRISEFFIAEDDTVVNAWINTSTKTSEIYYRKPTTNCALTLQKVNLIFQFKRVSPGSPFHPWQK